MAINIKDKIAKLLALAESPNENEAKAALLKARELMAEHKLRPEDVKKAKKEKVIRIRSGGRSVVCDAAPITYWSVRDGASMSEMLSLLTPNGESIYGTPAGKLENAVGVAYHPHTCGLLPIFHRGRDSWSRPVYDDGTGRLLVDVDPRAGRKPDICTKQGNAFDGEPCDPVDGDFIFIPRRDTW